MKKTCSLLLAVLMLCTLLTGCGEKPKEEEYEGVDFTKDERRSYVFAALGASALIAAVFIVVFAVVIALMFFLLK